MSVNLFMRDGAKNGGREIKLIQTTTVETFEILKYDKDTGKPEGGDVGVRDRYLAYAIRRAAEWADVPDWWFDHIVDVWTAQDPRFMCG